ncbi:PQQ-binding-like beta-propeller repeat protein [Phenylobacterium sp.]|uniref:outer membrane protein assembly factor BamB family protein n=1 Tax=Phenylobacterium sp. TaxID=1871053 RepID=UPI00301BF93A
MVSERAAGWAARIWAWIGGGLVALVGLPLLLGGGYLVFQGGSPYYLLAGAAVTAAGVMAARRHPAAGLVYAATLAATLGWALWEAGFAFWPLLPRLFAPAVLGLFLLLVIPTAPRGGRRNQSGAAVALTSLVLLGVQAAAIPATFSWGQAASPAVVRPQAPGSEAPAGERAADWRAYGRDPGGSRYSPVDQINRENVDELEVAWTFRTAIPPHAGDQDQNTPQMVGDTVYVCTPRNVVIALDPDTGREKWRHDPKVQSHFWHRCRGVGYWDGTEPALTPGAATGAPAAAPAPTAAAAAKGPVVQAPANKAAAKVAPAPAPQTPGAQTPGAQTPAPQTPARQTPATKVQATAGPDAGAAQVAAAPAQAAPPACVRRVLSSTINAQLIALDADTGRRCPGFGEGGVVDLRAGMGEFKPPFYFQTSMPTVAGNLVIVGGWVLDNQALGEPSGVVRAYDVVTGELAWAWDLGNPAIDKLPPEGQTYTRGTPNMWSTPAYDPALGLIYLPIGNATPDYWGSHRTVVSERYSSSVVALDVRTGKERWRFQTVHHDVWDYDVPAQPMLIDFPVGEGSAPALIQLTKRGQIFVLDRRTGTPLTRVVESPAPQGAMPGEWLSPTQPYSAEMPAVGVEALTEKRMWGATPLDQLACRIRFRSVRYEGDFTPPGSRERPGLQFPGNAGGMNWGSGAFDPRRGLLIVSDVRMPQTVSLERTGEARLSPARIAGRPAESARAIAYASKNEWLLSPLFAPCLEPPHGMLSAIDVHTREVVWQVPAGTAEAQAPLGLRSGLPIPIGTLGVGGPITTAGGVTFRAATTDPYLWAYDNATGAVLWKGALPVPAAGTPSTYVSPKTGKQYVVVSAGGGGNPLAPKGDHVVAFALP